MIKLSIITPYYNTLKYTKRLGKQLSPQLTEEVEWIIIDDGTHEKELDKMKAKVIHLKTNSGNASKPRNIGLDNAQGDYIAFVDSDDQVSSNYVEEILRKTKQEDFDYCYISWKIDSYKYVIKEEPPKWNNSVWNCIYKKELIGDIRFDETYNIGEDKVFNRKVRKGKRANIEEILYHYSWKEREDNLTNLALKGIKKGRNL